MFDLNIKNKVAWLTLSRPEARNAISSSHWPLLESAVQEAEASGARILLLLGAGEAFCAGADLSDFAAMRDDPKARIRFRLAMRGALDRLRDAAMPTAAIIDGACFGAGVALAMACDLRLAGARASFAITPAKLGISYPQEDISRLVTLVGSGQAARLLFGAAAIDAAEAERIGLVEQNAGPNLPAAVDALVAAITSNSPASLALLKRGLRLAAAGKEQDDHQDAHFEALLGSDELTERLSALRSRPRP